ncbi:MAG: tRNA (adenosine(37)-N6)-threonylcarbamoyltransferase complex ATPase subunit type 1 TsaE [Oscillospiraceae bacterium]|nr:tRNA (adenosine(37)-N6)-threonylcarbamoyltransferase complex ATPase subunit type 1 TsaE [Oscillospiraceae bacterium]
MKSFKLISKSPDETAKIAERLAGFLKAGDVVAFTGGLGAGKTAFIRACAGALGFGGEVASPTFALVHEYAGTPPIVHFDMYRIENAGDLFLTGFFDYLESGAVLFIEWSENISGALPGNTVFVRMSRLSDSEREIIIEGVEGF